MKNFIFNLQRFATIINSSPNKKLVGTDGNDNIFNHSRFDHESGVEIPADNVHIYTGAGNDYVDSEGGRNIHVYAGIGFKNINVSNLSKLYANNSIIDGFSIADTLYANNSKVYIGARTIYATGGNNLLTGWYNLTEAHAGSGNDTFIGGFKTLDAGDGNNKINVIDTGTITSGTGNDYIDGVANVVNVAGGKNTIKATIYQSLKTGAGDDQITLGVYSAGESSVTVDAGEGNNKISLKSGSYFSVKSGSGNDTLRGGFKTLDAGDGNNKINVIDTGTITSGTGNDYIDGVANVVNVAGGKNTIKATIYQSLKTGAGESSVTVDAGESNNKISLKSGSYFSVKSGSGNDFISTDLLSRSTIQTGLGDDTIINRYDYNSIVAGSEDLSNLGDNDKNYIENTDSYSTLQGGNGSDTVRNKSAGYAARIYTSFGNDSIRNEGYNTSINSGWGNDTIENYSRGVTISAEGGNDFINNYNPRVSIDAGEGNDTIKNSAKGVSIHAGAGNDVVSLYAHTPIEDWAGVVARALSPLTNDIVSYVLGFDVFGTLNNVKILTDGTKTFDEKKDALFDVISDYSERINDNLTADSTGKIADNFKDLIESYNKLVTLGTIINDTAEALDEFQTNKIFQILGEQILSDFEQDDNGRGCFAWNKNINNPTTVSGGTVDDKIISDGFAFHVYEYAEGDGNDTITGWNINDTLKIAASSYTSLRSGNDLIIQVGNGSILLKDAETKRQKFNRVLQVVCNSVESSSGNVGDFDSAPDEIVDAGIYSTYSGYRNISGTSDDDFIFNSGTGVTIRGGAGNDKIINIGEKVTFNHTAGNDTIYGFGAKDSLKIAQENYETIQSGDDLIIKIGDGSVKLRDVAALDVVEVYNGFVFKVHEEIETALNIDNTESNKFIAGSSLVDEIKNSADNVTINGGDNSDQITNSGSNVI